MLTLVAIDQGFYRIPFFFTGVDGMCIDANQRLIKKHRYVRPRDKAVCALISDVIEERNFYQISNNVLSTTDERFLGKYKKEGQKVEIRTMPTQTLTAVLEEANAPKHIDILSIDTEEHDFNVLKSLDFQKFSPELIILEIEEFDPNAPGKSPVYQYLTSNGYYLEGFILTNVYFRKIVNQKGHQQSV